MKPVIIFTKRSVAMQALLDSLLGGHSYYCNGSSPVSKIEKAVSVFEHDYHCFLDRNERAKRKRQRLGNSRSVLFLVGDQVLWWLLATPAECGHHPLHKSEKLRDAFAASARIEIDGFELVRLPKIGSDQTKLTWRMTQAKYELWRTRIIQVVRSRSFNQMHRMLYELWASPGFNGIRSQVGKLASLYRAETKRAGLKDAPKPPARLSYVRRIRHDGLTVKALLVQCKAEKLSSAEVIHE